LLSNFQDCPFEIESVGQHFGFFQLITMNIFICFRIKRSKNLWSYLSEITAPDTTNWIWLWHNSNKRFL